MSLQLTGGDPGFRSIAFESFSLPNSLSNNLKKFRYLYDGKEDFVILDENTSSTWVVYFPSFGGSALEIYNSPLIHPLWLDAVKTAGFGLASFENFGNSWMAPFVADAVHRVLGILRNQFGIKRFIFIGGSMGGSAVLIYCVRYPLDVFAALAMCPVSDIGRHCRETQKNCDPDFYMNRSPISQFYGKSEEMRESNFQKNCVQRHVEKLTMPLVISHGGKDVLISVSQSDELAELLSAKTDFRYFRYPDGGHELPSAQGFKDSWPWLMNQIKEGVEKECPNV